MILETLENSTGKTMPLVSGGPTDAPTARREPKPTWEILYAGWANDFGEPVYRDDWSFGEYIAAADHDEAVARFLEKYPEHENLREGLYASLL